MVLWLTLTLLCQLVGVASEFAHLWSVQSTGRSMILMDWLSHIAQWAAQFGAGALLVLLGWGWTLSPDQTVLGRFIYDNPGPGGQSDKVCACCKREMGALGPASALIVLGTLEATLALNAKAYARGVNVHHDYEAWPGKLVVALRVLCAALFGMGVHRQRKRLAAADAADAGANNATALSSMSVAQQQQLRAFLTRLALAGLAFLFALPAAVIIGKSARSCLDPANTNHDVN